MTAVGLEADRRPDPGRLETQYPDNANTDLLSRIPADARTILDVGCGTGALGAAYRTLNSGARLLGIERDPEMAAIARQRLDAVACVDVQQNPLPFELPEGIDCLIYGDVLQQLRDPWTVLRRQLEALNPGGSVLVCVANAEHWSMVARLLSGTWHYERAGLLDVRHLRWFSLRNVMRELVDAGLAVDEVHPRIFAPEQAQQFVQTLAPGLRRLGIDPGGYLPRALPLQYVLRARRAGLQTTTASAVEPAKDQSEEEAALIVPATTIPVLSDTIADSAKAAIRPSHRLHTPIVLKDTPFVSRSLLSMTETMNLESLRDTPFSRAVLAPADTIAMPSCYVMNPPSAPLSLSDTPHKRIFPRQMLCPEMWVARLDEVYYLPYAAPFLPDTKILINDYLLPGNPNAVGCFKYEGDASYRFPIDLDEICCVDTAFFMGHPISGDFGHFVGDCLSRMHAWQHCRELFGDVKIILDQATHDTRFRDRLLARAGVNAEDIVFAKGAVRCRKLLLASPALAVSRYASPTSAKLWQQIRDAVTPSHADGGERVYLSGSSQSAPILANELEVGNLFKNFGFSIVHVEDLALEEQISIVSNAQLVAGPAGPTMFSLAFQRRLKSALILLPETFVRNSEWLFLAGTQCPLYYHFGLRDMPAGSPVSAGDAWRVDVSRLAADLASWLWAGYETLSNAGWCISTRVEDEPAAPSNEGSEPEVVARLAPPLPKDPGETIDRSRRGDMGVLRARRSRGVAVAAPAMELAKDPSLSAESEQADAPKSGEAVAIGTEGPYPKADDEPPRFMYRASIMACARWEMPYITEWLLYHRAIGFDHVYLFCNDDDPTELYREVLPFLQGDPFVTFRHFPFQGQQFQMYMHGLRQWKDETQWLMFLDIDEFLCLREDSNIKVFLDQTPSHWDCIQFNWLVFGNNGFVDRPAGSVLQTYTRRSARLHKTCKTLTRTVAIDLARIDRKIYIWHGWDGVLANNAFCCNVLGIDPADIPVEGALIASEQDNVSIMKRAVIHHYGVKSLKDFRFRYDRGIAGDFSGQAFWNRVHERGAAEAEVAPLNEVEDTTLKDYWSAYLRRGATELSLLPSPGYPNIALGKVADQSSVSKWSKVPDRRTDAAGAISGRLTGSYQFHTDFEPSPWWMVDLGGQAKVYEIRIFNRMENPAMAGRLRELAVQVSDDGEGWRIIATKAADVIVGGVDANPLRITWLSSVSARFVRIRLMEQGVLHLDQVEVYGEPAGAPTGARVAELSQEPQTAGGFGFFDNLTHGVEAPMADANQLRGPRAPIASRDTRFVSRSLLSMTETVDLEKLRDTQFSRAVLAPADTVEMPACYMMNSPSTPRSMSNTPYNHIFPQPMKFPEMWVARLDDVYYLPYGAPFFPDLKVLINDFLVPWGPGAIGWFKYEGNDTYQLPMNIDEAYSVDTAFFLGHPISGHFGHFLGDCLSRMHAWQTCRQLFGDVKIILENSAHDTGFQRKLLAGMGVTAEDIVVAKGGVRCRRLLCASRALGVAQYVSPISGKIWRQIRDSIAGPHVEEGERVYLSRSAQPARKLTNEREVECLFESLGFKVVRPEDRPVEEQILIVSNARFIAGPTGSGMFNLAFQNQIQSVLILVPETFVQNTEWLFLAGAKCSVYYHFGQRDMPDGSPVSVKDAWRVELPRLASDIASWLSRV